ncbi:Subtilisin-like protein [Mycena indigotica]|uniref:tripeptidyl-peptidase II n=1 Tax=Mycena indigotica TaxID=2126181 RepID=A0A8H6WFP2_9AGAR|nr:Subtilisin-like protein [Mycena indigotica]KAF7314956.1 Subtilisin-like protein [Mycena indigotica]
MLFSGLWAFLSVAAVVSGRKLVVLDRRTSVPTDFVHSGVAPAEQILNLRINLAQRDLPGLETALNAASFPDSPLYGQWLSKEQVESFVRPTEKTTSAVAQWLAEHGIASTPLTHAGDWVSFTVPVSKANEMLNADFNIFTHVPSGKQSIRTLAYAVPAELAPHINLIAPTTSFSRPMRAGPMFTASNGVVPKPEATPPASCNTTITPACLQALYNIRTTPAVNQNNSIGVAGFGNQFANQADLTQFLRAQRPDMSPTTSFAVTSVDGGTNSQTLNQAGIEADLDIQYTVGLATGVPVNFVSVGTRTQDGPDEASSIGFLDIVNALLAEAAPPQVLTISYGLNTEMDLSQPLTVAMCNAYMQLAARGSSLMYASGDGGVAATPGETCGVTFLPTFPTCAFITLVGATENVPERGAELSAGGFSNYFPQQSWQSTAVNAYLAKLGTTFAGKFNASGRAFPDVSAQGQRVQIVQRGRTGTVAGTSCSSPIFASVIGLLNDELISAGKPVLGWLNPWIYANPQMFNDITTGNNPGCGTSGFPAMAGWDPVTGMGTPNYAAMRIAAGLS